MRTFWPGVDGDICTSDRRTLEPHRGATLAETGRLRLVLYVVEDDRPRRRPAERFQAHRLAHTQAQQQPMAVT